MNTPCLNCPLISDDNLACCAGPMLGIPYSEPFDFRGEFGDEPVSYPEECYTVIEFEGIADEVLGQLGELIEESDDKGLKSKWQELEMWQGWLSSVREALEKKKGAAI